MKLISKIRAAVSGLFHQEQKPVAPAKPLRLLRAEADGKLIWQMRRNGLSFREIESKLKVSDSTALRRLRDWTAGHQTEVEQAKRLDAFVGAFAGISLGMRGKVEPPKLAPAVAAVTPPSELEPGPQAPSPITEQEKSAAALRASSGLDQASWHLALSRSRDEAATPALESATVERSVNGPVWITFDQRVFELAKGRYPVTLVRGWTSALSKQFRATRELWIILPELESPHDTVTAPAPMRESLNRLLNSMPGDVRAKVRQYDFRHIPIPAPEHQTDLDARLGQKVDAYIGSGMTREEAGRTVLAEYGTAVQPWRGKQDKPEPPSKNDGTSFCS